MFTKMLINYTLGLLVDQSGAMRLDRWSGVYALNLYLGSARKIGSVKVVVHCAYIERFIY